jgi:hypothetical protein
MELYQESPENDSIAEMAELKALGNSNFLTLLILFEKKIACGLLRPKSKPLRNGVEWNGCGGTETGFVWIVGLTSCDNDLVDQQLKSDIQSQLTGHAAQLHLEVATYEEAMQRMVV